MNGVKSIQELFSKPFTNQLLMQNSEIVVKNLPQVIQRFTFPHSGEFQNFLITRQVSVEDIKQAFRRANFDIGLLALGEPERDMTVVERSAENISVGNGKRLEIFCRVDALPNPSFSLNFKGHALTSTLSYDPETDTHLFVFAKEQAREIDSGEYKCVIKQKRNGVESNEIILSFNVQVERDFCNQEWHLRLNSQTPLLVKTGQEVRLSVTLNFPDLSQFTFKWFRKSTRDSREEKIQGADKPELKIEKCYKEDEGFYRCLVKHIASGTEKLTKEDIQIMIDEQSEYDLKAMLIIGNADYENEECPFSLCRTEYESITSMDIFWSLSKLKIEMEALGFLVTSFVNLSGSEYIKAIQLFKSVCEKAQKVLVFVYVTGHGYNYLTQDYLIPVDSHDYFHNSGYRKDNFLMSPAESSLNNLMHSFASNEDQKFTVGVLWDMCRTNMCTKDINFYSFKKSINYNHTILYSCNIGREGYFYNREEANPKIRHFYNVDGFPIQTGTIFGNLFLKNLNKKLELHQIGELMNEAFIKLKDIQKLQKNFPEINKIMSESSPIRMKIGLDTNRSRAIDDQFNELYIKPFKEVITSPDQILELEYGFSRDEFVNTIVFTVETKQAFSLKYDPILRIEPLEKGLHKKKYRIFNWLRCDFKHMQPIKIIIYNWYPPLEGSKARMICDYSVELDRVINHFELLKKRMDMLYTPNLELLNRFDVNQTLDSNFSVSSTSINSSEARAGEDSYTSNASEFEEN